MPTWQQRWPSKPCGSMCGVTWSPYSTGLPRVAVFDMALQNVAGNRRLRIGTHGRGVWERVPVTVPVELQGIEIGP